MSGQINVYGFFRDGELIREYRSNSVAGDRRIKGIKLKPGEEIVFLYSFGR